MPLYPGAQWRPILCNYSGDSIVPRFLVVHGIQGTLASADAWFRDDRAQASAHFGIGKRGAVYQWVNTTDKSWHAAGANSIGIGVEMEMYQGEQLTDPQMTSLGHLFAWVHKTSPGVPVRRASGPEDAGLIGHSQGGSAWGGHQDPGPLVQAQFPRIVSIAGGLPYSPPKSPPFPYPAGHYLGQPDPSPFCHSGYYGGEDNTNVHTWQSKMAGRGWTITADGRFGPQSDSVARQFQSEKGLGADGKVGTMTWNATWTAPVT